MKNLASYKRQFFVLWIVNPFFSAIMLLREIKSVHITFPYLLISFFFGASFVISSESTADSVRYQQQLKSAYDQQESLADFWGGVYSEDGEVDLYQPILTWLISRITDNYRWLFGVYGLVFGYFWFGSIRLARSLLPDRLPNFFLLLILFFAMINPIWNISGVRMWTATGVFFYGLLLLHHLNSKKGYLFLIGSVFIHFSLTSSLSIYLLFSIVPIRNFKVIYFIYLATFLIGELDLQVVRDYFELMPDFIQSRKVYLNEVDPELIEGNSLEQAIHIKLYGLGLNYFIFFIVSLMYFYLFSKAKNYVSDFTKFFALTLIFCAFSNIVKHVPSGGRFITLSNLLATFSFIWYSSSKINGKIPRVFQSISVYVLLFMFIVSVRGALDYIGIFLFLGNPVINFIIEEQVPIIDFVKQLIA